MVVERPQGEIMTSPKKKKETKLRYSQRKMKEGPCVQDSHGGSGAGKKKRRECLQQELRVKRKQTDSPTTVFSFFFLVADLVLRCFCFDCSPPSRAKEKKEVSVKNNNLLKSAVGSAYEHVVKLQAGRRRR